MWGHFLAISVGLVSIAIVVATLQYTHADSAARLYESTLLSHSSAGSALLASTTVNLDADEGEAASVFLVNLGREGARWAHSYHFEATVWAGILAAAVLFIVGYHLYQAVYGNKSGMF